MQVYEAVAATLSKHASVLFGLMGDANMHYVTAYQSQFDGRYVAAADERNAVLMAAGYSTASGTVGVATVTHGPGLTHTLTSVIGSARARTPLVLFTSEAPSVRDHAQDVDIRAVISASGAGYERAYSQDTASRDIAKAFWRAAVERRPIIMDVPFALLRLTTDELSEPLPVIRPRVGPDEEALDQALGLALSSRNPIVLAGRGAVNSSARDALIELADVLGAPVATTLLAKDYFRGHPLDLGLFGSLSTPVATEHILESDCVLAFGCSLNKYTSASNSLLKKTRVVHIDNEIAGLGQNRRVDVAIMGDARTTAEVMIRRLTADQVPSRYHDNRQLQAALAAESPSDEFTDESTADTIDVRTAMVMLDGLLPHERNLVTDTGRFVAIPWRYIHINDPHGFQRTGFGSIGQGVGLSIGVATARPGRPTVAVVGDGGFMQAASELATAARYKVPVIFVIANDAAYGAEWRQLEAYGIDPNFSRSVWPDFVALARVYGIPGHSVRTAGDLEKAAANAREVAGPFLIDLHLDPSLEPGKFTGR